MVQDNPCSVATPDTARGSVRSAPVTAAARRVVTLARAGNWSVTSVNVPRGHNSSAQTYRRLRTPTITGCPPQVTSLTC